MDLLTSEGARGFLRVRRPNSQGAINTTNSEGISYGMLIAVYMDKQDVFDRLWKYEQLFLDANGLMNWEINPEGTGPTGRGQGAATDGDEDMAFALLMADKKWGGRGTSATPTSITRRDRSTSSGGSRSTTARGDLLMPGDQFSGAQVTNISYFAPAYYRVFGEVTGKTADWNKRRRVELPRHEATLNTPTATSTTASCPPGRPPKACHGPRRHRPSHLPPARLLPHPFRIAQDACWSNEPRAFNYLRKISSFYSSVGARNIIDGYNLNGNRGRPGMNLILAAFVGAAGVGAMAVPEYATLRDEAYTAVASLTLLGGSLYYNESWTVLSLLMMNGVYLR